MWRSYRILPALVLAGCGHTPDLGPPLEGGPPAALEVLAGDGQTAEAGDTLPLHIVVRVSDSTGRAVAGVTVGFSAAGAGGTFVPAEPETDDQGKADVRWVLGARAGGAAATARVAGLEPVSLSAMAVPGPPAPSRSTISADRTTLLVGDSTVIRVVAADRLGNPIAGAPVHLNVSGSGGSLTQPAATDAEGLASGGLRATEPGPEIVSAEVAGVALTGTATVTVASVPPVVAAVTVSPATPATPVGGTVQLTAVVRDNHGDTMTGVPVDWSTSDAGVATVDADGTVSGRAVGGATISATADGHTGSAQLAVSYGEGVLNGLTYCTIDGVADLMDVYVPSAAKPRPLPVAVHVHGGGWNSGQRSRGFWFDAIANTLLDRGYLVVSLDYRFAPTYKYPSQIQDVACAIRHLRAKASRYGLDPDRIGTWGASAGAQLVALLGTMDGGSGIPDAGGFPGQSSRVQTVVGMSTITDFTSIDELRDNYRREFPTWPDPDSPELIQASPVTHVSSDDPPFFFIVGDADTLVLPAQSARMDSLLRAEGVESSVLHVANANHGLEPETGPIEPDSATIITRMANFLDRHLR
ncbi:MAG TPA: Ig-like domain-containing protein [Gemmatimonadales bacterium]|nr:Ig-like domain-containing protein [Gemmatimonadales bacterium]